MGPLMSLRSDDSPDAFHEQPGRETPPYGRGYSADFQSRLQAAAERTRRAKEAEDEAAAEENYPPWYIAKRCREIQKEWSPRERAKRAGVFGRIPGALVIPEAKVTEGFL